MLAYSDLENEIRTYSAIDCLITWKINTLSTCSELADSKPYTLGPFDEIAQVLSNPTIGDYRHKDQTNSQDGGFQCRDTSAC